MKKGPRRRPAGAGDDDARKSFGDRIARERGRPDGLARRDVRLRESVPEDAHPAVPKAGPKGRR